MQRFVTAAAVGLLLLAAVTAAPAAPSPNDRTLVLEAGSGKVLRASRPIANLFAADPKIAEVRPASPTSVFVFGVAVGHTTVAAFDDAGDMIAEYDVTVTPSTYAASQASQSTAAAVPGSHVNFAPTANGLAVTGRVATPGEAEQAVAIGKDMVGDKGTVDNRLSVEGATQVNLRVRFAEISRAVTRQLGINWSALGSIGRIGVAGY